MCTRRQLSSVWCQRRSWRRRVKTSSSSSGRSSSLRVTNPRHKKTQHDFAPPCLLSDFSLAWTCGLGPVVLLCCTTGVLCLQAGGRPETASGGEVHPDGEVCCEEVEALQNFQSHSPGGPGTGTLTHTHTLVCCNWLPLFLFSIGKSFTSCLLIL